MRKKINKVLYFSIFTLVVLITSCSLTNGKLDDSNVIYVDTNASGMNNGKSWENAFNSLQDALSVATENNEIWVAKGTYYPTDTKDRTISFVMVDNVDIYGGFVGNETSLDQRDWQNNKTILSGDIGVKGVKTDNSIKVVVAANNIIDGFTISDGYFSQRSEINLQKTSTKKPKKETSNKGTQSVGHMSPKQILSGNPLSSVNGNGILIWQVSPTIRNCIITNNEGGKGAGVYILSPGDSDNLPTFINTTISNNIAEGRGGGVSIDMNSQAAFIDCVFDSNQCVSGKGGAIYNDFGSSPLIENSLFINNVAESGAAIANDGESNPIISNSTFYNNEASEAGAALYQGTGPSNDPVVIDSIIWGNYCTQDKISVYNFNECIPTIKFSIIEGGYDGEGVLDLDPMFVDAENKDFNLQDNSPALTASHNGSQIGFNQDVINNREESDYNDVIDYLNSIEGSKEPIQMDLSNPISINDVNTILNPIYVDIDATGENDGSSWDDAYTSLQKAINVANAIYQKTNEEVDIWVSEGTYLTGDLRSDSIILQSGVNIYGGFSGVETSLEQRDFEKNKTIISSEIGDKTT